MNLNLMQIAGLLMSAFSTVSKVFQQRRESEAQQEFFNYQAQLSENNAAWDRYYAEQEAQSARRMAKVAEHNAAISKWEASLEAKRKRREGEKLLKKQRAAYAKAGVTLEGTPLLVLEETYQENELDALLEEWQGDVQAWQWLQEKGGYESEAEAAIVGGDYQANMHRAEAGINRARGAMVGRQGKSAIAGTILGGAAQGLEVYQKYATN